MTASFLNSAVIFLDIPAELFHIGGSDDTVSHPRAESFLPQFHRNVPYDAYRGTSGAHCAEIGNEPRIAVLLGQGNVFPWSRRRKGARPKERHHFQVFVAFTWGVPLQHIGRHSRTTHGTLLRILSGTFECPVIMCFFWWQFVSLFSPKIVWGMSIVTVFMDSKIMDGFQKRIHDTGVRIVRLCQFPQLFNRFRQVKAFSISTLGGHGVEGISNTDNPGFLGNLFTLIPFGITAAFISFVVGLNDGRISLKEGKEDRKPYVQGWMGLYLFKFLRRSKGLFCQGYGRVFHFTNIVEKTGNFKPFNVILSLFIVWAIRTA